jgi:3-methyladenine DNA glycosylase AlkD
MKDHIHIDQAKAIMQELEASFSLQANPYQAERMAAYMKNHFPFLGIMKTERTALTKEMLKVCRTATPEIIHAGISLLWQKPEREYHYFAIEWARAAKAFKWENAYELIAMLTEQNQWWDSVDTVAAHLTGPWAKLNLEKVHSEREKWLTSPNMWWRRTAIIYQLNHKKETDTIFLEKTIDQLHQEKEFFIRKAIGWALRQYARTDADWVIEICEKYPLSGLSRREALKHLGN